ncbi:lipopolysaccharide biosynthesis protein [uncultured Methylobacterium sp.]|uniref:lipopolysaccharide biosynthesis protein n=1 Tax=uncultured Methylobacterium sp. TaxID=157278 RepID=UPI0035CB7846
MTIGTSPAWVFAAARRHHRTLAGVVDQGVVGIGNLAVGLLVLRAATKEEYGLYSLCYMTLILLNGFSNAVFAAQLTVSYHERPRQDRDGFAASLLRGQLLLSASLSLVVLAIAGLLPERVLPAEMRELLMVSALACPAVMAHDFLRSYFFLVDRPMNAVMLDLLLVTGWFVGTIGLGAGAMTSHTLAGLAAFGLSACVAAGAGLVLSRLPLRAEWRSALGAVAVAWNHGRWALGGAAVTALQNQGHVYLLGWLGSARAVGELNAARVLMMPMGLLIVGVGRTLTPAMARLAAEGRLADMSRTANRTLTGVVSVIGLYSLAMLAGEDWLIGRVLGASYAGIGPLVALWMVVLLLQAVDANLSAVMQVAKRFRELTIINMWTVGPVVAGAIPMIMAYGAEGNLVALAAGYAGITLLLWREAKRAMAGLRASVAGRPRSAEVVVGVGKPDRVPLCDPERR